MPPRSVLKPKQGRPVSAVYIGNGVGSISGTQEPSHSAQLSTSNSPGLPELPEPPSPSSSMRSVGSGLPSPPATNSTGSGSTGDPATIAIRSRRPLSHDGNSSTSTSSGSHTTPVRLTSDAPSRSSSRLSDNQKDDPGANADFDHDYDREKDNDNESILDGDDTARLDRKLLGGSTFETLKSRSSSENQAVLRRAKSLAERNRLAMDKLSRLGSPSPRSGTPNSRSPAASQAGSSRSQTVRTARLSTQVAQRHESIRSGSETERESTYQTNSTHSSSSHSHSISSIRRTISHSSRSHRSTTPPSGQLSGERPHSSTSHRPYHISTSDSPHKPRSLNASLSSDSNSHNPSNRRRNRTSVASVQLTDFEEEDNGVNHPDRRTASGKKDRTLNEAEMIAQSALAAVASARRSPVGQRRRSALPREFRSDLGEDSPPGSVPERRTTKGGQYENQQDSPVEERQEEKSKMPSGPFTPFRSATNGLGRSSTVCERRTVVSGRWSSGDYRTPATVRTRPFNTSYSNEDGNPRKERRQSVRGGSVEGALWSPGGRSLIGEGLRAAGLTRRRDDESRRAAVTNGGTKGAVFKERVRKVDWSPHDMIDDGSWRPLVDKEHERSVPPRASTSMAQYQYMDRESPEIPRDREEPHLRGHRSTYSLVSRDRDRDSIVGERATSALGRFTPGNITGTPRLAVAHLQERLATASPFGSRRYSGQPPLTPQTEHARLMLDSLTMFETSLAKLPRTATHSTSAPSAHTDVLHNAQGMVFAADRLYNLLKQGSSRAVEAQVEAEVESPTPDFHVKDIIELWGKVAADYREGSRMADDLIRGITGVLLGMGRVMREFAVDRGLNEYGSPSMHGRHASLGDDLRRTSPDVVVQYGDRLDNSSDGQSTMSRHSWEASKDRDKEREETLRRLAGGSNAMRPESVLARASPATFQRLKNYENSDHQRRFETPSPAANGRLNKSQPNAARRSSTPRDNDTKAGITLRGPPMTTVDSQETVQPSPTPASRQRGSPVVDRPRALPPLSIPRPLPTLPSETLLRRAAEKSADNEHSTTTRDRDRRRTIRGSERPSFPSLTSPANPTIALTPHTVSNAERFATTIQRTGSGDSGPSRVTFSRPTAVSVSKSLSELQHADGERKRTISITKPDGNGFDPSNSTPGMSSLENELDAKRKTFGIARARMSLDDDRAAIGVVGDSRTSTSHAADRSAATSILTTTVKRERRRTVTDIWPR